MKPVISVHLPAAKSLARHIRRCCNTLADGTTRLPRRRPAHWLARLSSDARYWRWPVLTPAARSDCRALGIDIDDRIQHLSGVEQLAAFLRAVEGPLGEVLSGAPAAEGLISVSRELESERYLAPQIRALPAILASLQAQDLPGVSLFLHGSMADLLVTPFSDVDDLVILHRAAWQDPRSLANAATALARLARGYQDVDPLQHHGHWLLTDFDLLLYDQSYLPLVILDRAVRVSGQPEIRCRIEQDLGGFFRNAASTVQAMAGRLARASRHGGLRAFDLKGLVGEIAILPAYLFQARGEFLDKARAIHRAGEIYSPGALHALEWATLVRDEFGELVHNGRTRLIGTVASLTCARRHQAETLSRRFSVWVGNRHRLGLAPDIEEAIAALMRESCALVQELAP